MLLPQPMPSCEGASPEAGRRVCFLPFLSDCFCAWSDDDPPISNVCAQTTPAGGREHKRATPKRLFLTGTHRKKDLAIGRSGHRAIGKTVVSRDCTLDCPDDPMIRWPDDPMTRSC